MKSAHGSLFIITLLHILSLAAAASNSGRAKRCRTQDHQHPLVPTTTDQTPITSDTAPEGGGSTTATNTTTSTTTSSSSSSNTEESPSPTPSYSGKRGVAFVQDNALSASAKSVIAQQASWYYTWNEEPAPAIHDDALEFIPTMWTGSDEESAQAVVDAVLAMSPRPKYIIGSNEPDIPSQADAEPEQVAQIYKKYMTQLSDEGIKVSAPSMAFDFDWLEEFFEHCGDDCPVHFLSVHHYLDWSEDCFENFKNDFIGKYRSKWPDLPMWITELAIKAKNKTSDANVQSLIKEAMEWFDSQDDIHRYSWFVTGYIPPKHLGKTYFA